MKTLFLLLLVASCGDTNFKKVEELKEFRILGVVASSPEVAPGGNSNLQLIVADAEGGGRVISGNYESCVDPGISQGATVSCAHDPTTVTGTYTIDTANDADLGAANLYTGLAEQVINVTVPAMIFTGRSSRDQYNGVGYITIFRFNVNGKTITAFKRVTATTRTALNSNPTITNILLNGTSINTRPAKDEKLLVQASAPETFDVINIDGTTESKEEEFALAWYVSSGELDKPKSSIDEQVKFTSSPSAGSFLLLTLLRDERGGIAVERIVLP